MPVSSTRRVALRTAALAAAAVAVPLTCAEVAAQQYHRPVQHAPAYHPAPRAAPQMHFNRPAPQPHFNRQAGPQPHFNRQVGPQPHFNRQAKPQPHFNRQAKPQPHFNRQAKPQPHFNRPTPQKFTSPQKGNKNFHAVNPGLQHGNPNFRYNKPSIQHVNPKFGPNLARPKGGFPGGIHGLGHGPGTALFRPAPGHGHAPFKPAYPAVSLHNKFWPIHKGGHKFIWFAGHRRFFVPAGLLGVALIGGSYWYPDGYVSIEGPACTGFTPDGCQLQWRMVDFEDGDAAPQCVQYCPQAGPPPAQVAELPPPPAVAENGTCQLTIFAEPDFGGLSAPTSDSQPALSETGWKNEISSVQVEAGTWDFFDAENFDGESLRLTAGTYPTLPPEWTKRIGSFMCVEPGPPGT